MKFKKVFLVSVIFLTILTLSAVSASDNIDELAVNQQDQNLIEQSDEEESVSIDAQDEISMNNENLDDFEKTSSSEEESVLGSNFNAVIDDSPRVDEKHKVLWVEDIPSNANGQLKVSINSKVVNSHTITKQDKINTFNEGWTLKELKISKPGTYSVMVKYVAKNGKSKVIAKFPPWKVSKAKPIKLSLNKVTIKSSTKKLTLTAGLKLNGKLAKFKKVVFKFNGKSYKVKTNKRGIAKVNIKQSVLKKLKVGKKVKYQVSYGKTIVKRTVKVQN